MSKKSNIGSILLAASSFLGGIGLGLILAPRSGRQSRKWLTDHASEIADWIDQKGRTAAHKGQYRLHKIRDRMEREYQDTIPDLYSATRHIDLDGSGHHR